MLMPKITFYRQKRRDGGLHTGLLVNGGNAWEHFEAGAEEDDPVLLWFIDIRAEGRPVPEDPEQARDWLMRHARLISQGMRNLARELRAGMDFNALPLKHEIPGAPEGTHLRIVCSAMRRFDSLQIGRLLTQFAREWQTDLRKLRPFESAPR
jgi:hypothetical protein